MCVCVWGGGGGGGLETQRQKKHREGLRERKVIDFKGLFMY